MDGRASLAWVARPDALRERDVIGRTLLDLAIARPADRLAGIGRWLRRRPRSSGMVKGAFRRPVSRDWRAASKSGRRGRRGIERRDPSTNGARPKTDRPTMRQPTTRQPTADVPARSCPMRRAPTCAAEALIALWTDVARDLALCQRGLDRSVRDLALLDDTKALAMRLDPDEIGRFIERSAVQAC